MKKILYGLMMIAMAQIAAIKLPPAAPAAYKMRFENATQSNIVVKFEYGACGAAQSPRIKPGYYYDAYSYPLGCCWSKITVTNPDIADPDQNHVDFYAQSQGGEAGQGGFETTGANVACKDLNLKIVEDERFTPPFKLMRGDSGFYNFHDQSIWHPEINRTYKSN